MFEGAVIGITGLIEIVMPSSTIRLCDGGVLDWPGRGLFRNIDPAYGTIGGLEVSPETLGDQAPGGTLTLLPPDVSDAGSLLQPTAQGLPIRFWFAEFAPDTGLLVGTPTMMFDGMIDQISVANDRNGRRLEIAFIDSAERLFMVKEANVLSPRWHKSLWPGETGLDSATGAPGDVPWGTTGPPRGSISSGSSGGIGGSFGRWLGGR